MPIRRHEALTFKADLVRRLRCTEGHLHGIAVMIERGEDWESVVRQLVAARGALREVNRLMLKQHLNICLQQLLLSTEGDASARGKYLVEIVALYQSLGVSAPLKGKERS